MNRDEMIRQLTDATLETVLSDPDLATLRSMLGKGFCGYETMSEERLRREMQLVGLLEFDDDEEDDDEDEEHTASFAPMPGLCIVAAYAGH